MAFPKQFVWGAATSSYQIEGAAESDGKGPSVWDRFCRKDGAVWEGHTGDVACDHYHRFADDVALMKQIGLGAYRFSISWPRVIPEGTGQVNARGLEFYSRLVDALLEAGITPYVTLFHWDYPLALYHRGGWLNRDSAEWFGEYTDVVVRALSDRVQHWLTQNEIQVFINWGHHVGGHAPGDQLQFKEVLRAGHHALMAHGRSVQAIRASARTPAQVAFAPVGMVDAPATDSAADREAARQKMFGVPSGLGLGMGVGWCNSWWMDPVLLGHYPEELMPVIGSDAPEVRDGDLELIHQPTDFLGVNIYQCGHVRAGVDDQPEDVPRAPGRPLTAFNWGVTPEALYWGPRMLHERYGRPMIITENGCSCRDWVSVDGKVHDPQRIDFATRYLRELHRAVAGGIPVEGYFHWSLMDNFEWAEGYRERFGMVHVDFQTQQRTLKDSAHWYREVIASNGDKALA